MLFIKLWSLRPSAASEEASPGHDATFDRLSTHTKQKRTSETKTLQIHRRATAMYDVPGISSFKRAHWA